MNSEHYKGQKLLSSLASLEKLTNTTASSFSASDKSNEETTGTPHLFLQDLKVCLNFPSYLLLTNLFNRVIAGPWTQGLSGD